MRLGRVFGVPVRLAPSWFVIAVVVVLLFAPQVQAAIGLEPPGNYLVAALYAVLLLVSVLIHELAHALAARAIGLPVHEIVADLWGGHTQYEDAAPTPGRTALVAVVGPVANAGLALLGWLALGSLDVGVTRLLVVALVFTNAFVAAFNLAPGLPLDGGRVVESAVWALHGRRWAGMLTAGWCGRVVAAAVVLWSIGRPLLAGRLPGVSEGIWAVLIAGLLWQGATAAIGSGRVLRRADQLRLAAHVEPARAISVDSPDWAPPMVRDPVSGVVSAPAAPHLVALDPAGRAVGVLMSRDAYRLLSRQTPRPPVGTPLSAVMTVLSPAVTLHEDASGESVLQALVAAPAQVYVVVDGSGRVIGVAEATRLTEQLLGHP